MFTIYRYFKSSLAVVLIAGLAWFTASSFAQEADDPLVPPPVEELQTKPKMLSEMTAAEKAQLSKEELQKLKDLEEKIKKLEDAQKKPGY